jgi:hypothetical protein
MLESISRLSKPKLLRKEEPSPPKFSSPLKPKCTSHFSLRHHKTPFKLPSKEETSKDFSKLMSFSIDNILSAKWIKNRLSRPKSNREEGRDKGILMSSTGTNFMSKKKHKVTFDIKE